MMKMDKKGFKDYLLKLAENEAYNNKYQFTRTTHNQIMGMISSGVNRMSVNELNDETCRRTAEKNIKLLVQYMVENAKKRNLTESLDERAFSAVHLSICPLWPFC